MYPSEKVNFICKFFCCAPNSSNPKVKKALCVYTWVTVAALFLVLIFGFTSNVYGDGYLVSSMATSAVFISIVTAHIVTIVESLIKRDEQMRFFAKLQELDEIFYLKLRHKINVQHVYRKLFSKYSIISFLVLFHFFFYMVAIILRDYKGFFWHGIVSVIVSRMRFIQASVYVELFHSRFENFNYLLRQIIQNCKFQQRDINLDVDFDHLSRPERVLFLKLTYLKLVDIVQCLNEIFGWSILAVVVYYCLDFTCNTYWQFLTWEKYLPSENNYECFATFVPIGLLLAMFCHTCNCCVNESVKTAQLVKKLRQNSLNEHTVYILDEFLLQILQQPTIIHAKRFFDVNLRLLTSITASILGYLVILIQFRLTENEL